MKPISIILLFFALVGCRSEVTVEDISYAPSIQESDKPYADIYKKWEGEWKGEFKIFEDLAPSKRDLSILNKLDASYFRTPSLKLKERAEVERIHQSDSPYFQRLEVREVYYSEQGEIGEVRKYQGVNKVQDGKLYSVLQSSDTLIVRTGKPAKGGIQWQRASLRPFLQESVIEYSRNDIYEIIGYGYYDRSKRLEMPRFLYYGRFERVRE